MEVVGMITGLYLLGIIVTMLWIVGHFSQRYAPEWIFLSWIGLIYLVIRNYAKRRSV